MATLEITAGGVRSNWLRRRLPSASRGVLVANLLVALLLISWEVYSWTVPEFVAPSPFKVIGKTIALFFDPSLAQHTYISLGRVLLSVTLSLLVGSTIVFIGRYVPILNVFVGQRIIPFLNSFPALGWAMLAVIWFGVNDVSVIFVETTILLPFVMINVWEGMKSLDQELLEMAHSFTRNRRKVLFSVILPMLFPYFFSALRLSFGLGWKIALLAELFGSTKGIGYLMNYVRQTFDTPLLFAIIVDIIIVVFIVDKVIFVRIDRRLSRWRLGDVKVARR